MAETKEFKKVRGYSLSPANIEWLANRARALSTATKRVSDSLFLDNIITSKREEQARAKRVLAQAQGKKP
jgi:hypothetical protein